MTEKTEQAVGEQPDTQDHGSENEGGVAQEEDRSAEDYLTEFDQYKEAEEKPKAEDEKPQQDLTRQEVYAALQEKEDEEKAYKAIVGDLDLGEKGDRFARIYLNGMATIDGQLKNAWLNRHKNPKAWDGLLKAVNKEIKDLVSPKTDAEATENRKKVTSAVKASTASSETPDKDIWGMKPGDFEQQKKSALRSALKGMR